MAADSFLDQLLALFMQRQPEMATPDQPDQLPPPLPPPDTLYQSLQNRPAQQLTRDMGIYATPRPSSEMIDQLIQLLMPGTSDSKSIINERDRENARFNFKPGYLWKS